VDFQNPIALNGGSRRIVASGVVTMSGVLSGNASSGINKLTTGRLVLTGDNTYQGATTVTAGTLQIGDGTTDGSISASSGITNNATLAYNLVGSQSYANAIGGTGSLTKAGAGSLTLGGNNIYTGATTVSAGTLLVNGTHIATTGGAGYTVSNSGSTLGGTGRLAINGSVSVASTAILAPGASIGTLTLDGVNTAGNVLNMIAGSRFGFELDGSGGTPDQLVFWNYLDGDLSLPGSTIDLSVLGTQTPGSYSVDIFRFFSDAGSAATTHAFSSGLTIGTLGTGISTASIDWNGTGDDNQTIALNYTVIPEPSAALLGSLGLLFLLRRRR
jgi:fibronectin-binding autotransporter adhesin